MGDALRKKGLRAAMIALGLRTGMILLLLAAGCQTLQLDGGRFGRDTDWLMDGKTDGRERLVHVSVVPPLVEAWKYNASAGFGPGSPLIVDDAVLVATRKGEVHAIMIDSGKKMGVKSFGTSIEGPMLIYDGTAFIPNAYGPNVLTAYDIKRARKIWRIDGIPFETAPVHTGRYIIGVDIEANVRAFDPGTGEEAWAYALGERAFGETSPLSLAGDLVFVVNDRGDAVMLRGDDGDVIWTSSVGYPVYSSPAAFGAMIFVPTTRGRLIALAADTGRIAWTFQVDDFTVRFTSPATDGEIVYVGTSDGIFYALDAATGTVRWQFDGPDAFTAAPLITNGHVYIGSMGRKLYGFDRTTESLVWETELDGRIKSALAAREGELIVLSEPRYVYMFRSEKDHDAQSN